MSDKKIALVTGSSKGIGAEIAKELAKQGFVVFINYSRDLISAQGVVGEIEKVGGEAVIVKGDVSDERSVTAIFAEIRRKYGRLDVLVNNAGVYGTGALSDLQKSTFNWHFDLNVFGTLFCCREALGLFGDKGGSIINIGSSVTSFTPPNSVVYTASKGAVDAITRTLSKELGGRKIRVNSVNPGLILTEGLSATGFSDDKFRASIETVTPLGRTGIPQDIAPAVAFLASEAASWISGEILVIGGGLH